MIKRLNLAYPQKPPHNDGSAFNSADEIGVSNKLADKPLPSGFFTSVYTTVAPSMVGRGGGYFGSVGFQFADTPTLLRSCLLRLASKGGDLIPKLEAITMPSPARVLLPHPPLCCRTDPAAIRLVSRSREPSSCKAILI
jgi:hypothetical protein